MFVLLIEKNQTALVVSGVKKMKDYFVMAIIQALPVLVMIVGSLSAVSRDVLTTQGVVRGYLVDDPEAPYYAYKAIFYARAKQHRFKAPKPAKRWDGTFEATYHVKCPQPDGAGTEDCLVVNVFTPQDASNLPVLVIVHDGNFQSGWGAFQPPLRLLAQSLVIVTFNYRLAALGFLCLGTTEAPGNAGLKDQVAALYWIQKNIASFGGNPHDVTVYGVGSGAASIQLILLSGAARGLLHKAILESGSALSPLSLSYDPVLTAFDAAVAMGYTGNDSSEGLTKFYRDSSVMNLINGSTVFLPCIEHNLGSTHRLLEMDPIETFKQKGYHAVPQIIAYTDMLGASKIASEVLNAKLPNSLDNLLPNNLQFEENTRRRVAAIVKEFYMGDQNRGESNENPMQNLMEYFNDVTYEYPIIKSTVLHAATSTTPTYFMKLLAKDEMTSSSKNAKCCKNILDYFYAKDLDDMDRIMVERLVTLWSNFIRIGDPTPLTTSLVPVLWQQVRTNEDTFDIEHVTGVVLGKTLQVSDHLAHNRILFWDQIYKKFYRYHGLPYNNIEIN